MKLRKNVAVKVIKNFEYAVDAHKIIMQKFFFKSSIQVGS